MEMNADFFYENFKNDANVIEGNIKDAMNGNIDLAHLTAKEAKKIFREAEQATNLLTGKSLLDGFSSREDMKDFVELLSLVDREKAVSMIKDDELMYTAISSMAGVRALSQRVVDTFEKDEANGAKFNADTMEYSGDNASFSIMAGSLNKAMRNMEEYESLLKEGIDLSKNKDVVAIASWLHELEKNGDKPMNDELIKGFIDICVDRDTYLKEHPYQFADKKEKEVKSKKAVKSKVKSAKKAKVKEIKENKVEKPKQKGKEVLVAKAEEKSVEASAEVKPEQKTPKEVKVFCHPAGIRPMKDEANKTIGYIVPGYKDAKGNSFNVELPFEGHNISKLYAFPKNDPIYNYVACTFDSNDKLKAKNKNGEIEITVGSFKNFIKNRNRRIKNRLAKANEKDMGR